MGFKLLASTASALVLSTSVNYAEAANYFVDADAGDDSFTGRFAVVQNGPPMDGPWKTITRVNSMSFLPGDAVYLRCGQRWRASLTISSSGTTGNPVTFGRYGVDCTDANKPVLSGADTLDNWSLYSGNIYVTNVTFLVAQVFVDGLAIRLAQYPDPGYLPESPDNVYLTVDPDPGSVYNTRTSFVDSELSLISNQEIVGAGLHLRTRDFWIEDLVVNAYDPAINVISWPDLSRFLVTDGWGYYLDNKLWMLDQPGEWYFDGSDPANMKLYVWMPDGTAPGVRVEGARSNYGINAANLSNIVIKGLKIEKMGVGVQLSGSSDYVLRHTDIVDSYFSGITTHNSSNGLIDSCFINNSVREGIESGSSTNLTVASNVVLNTGVIGSPKTSSGAISLWDQFSTIRNNWIENAGYHGIAFGKNSTVSNNYVENACLVLNDCAGIYTGNISRTTGNTSHNSEIHGNTIVGAYGNSNGRKPGLQETLVHGIYLDYRLHGLAVRENTIVNADSGIFVHAAYDNVIARNTVYNSKTFAMRLFDRIATTVGGNNVIDNTFFSLNGDSVLGFKPILDNITPANLTIYNNHYSSLYTEDSSKQNIANVKIKSGDVWTVTDFDITQWQQLGFDTQSTIFDTFSIAPFIYQSTGLSNLIANGTFDFDASDWFSWSPENDASIDWSIDCITAGCLAFTTGAQSNRGLAVSNRFSLEQDKDYLLSFDVRADITGQNVTVLPRMAGPVSFDAIAGRHEFIVSDVWQNYSFIFKSPADLIVGPDSNGARVDFVSSPNQTLYLDNINVEEVSAVFNIPEDDSAILLNPTPFAADIDCPDINAHPEKCAQYVYFRDATPVVWPVTLPARGSEIVIWAGNPFIRR